MAGAVESMALQLNTHAEGGSTQHALVADKDSSVKIYYSGNKKLETTNTGIVVTGILTTTDLDVDGHTELDNVRISGITTTQNIQLGSSRILFAHSGGTASDHQIWNDGSDLRMYSSCLLYTSDAADE